MAYLNFNGTFKFLRQFASGCVFFFFFFFFQENIDNWDYAHDAQSEKKMLNFGLGAVTSELISNVKTASVQCFDKRIFGLVKIKQLNKTWYKLHFFFKNIHVCSLKLLAKVITD